MSNIVINAPKDYKITDKDDSITNKDSDNNLEKGQQVTAQNKPDDEGVPTIIPDSDNGTPRQPADKNASNKNARISK